jgi:hypothetical protein
MRLQYRLKSTGVKWRAPPDALRINIAVRWRASLITDCLRAGITRSGDGISLDSDSEAPGRRVLVLILRIRKRVSQRSSAETFQAQRVDETIGLATRLPLRIPTAAPSMSSSTLPGSGTAARDEIVPAPLAADGQSGNARLRNRFDRPCCRHCHQRRARFRSGRGYDAIRVRVRGQSVARKNRRRGKGGEVSME